MMINGGNLIVATYESALVGDSDEVPGLQSSAAWSPLALDFSAVPFSTAFGVSLVTSFSHLEATSISLEEVVSAMVVMDKFTLKQDSEKQDLFVLHNRSQECFKMLQIGQDINVTKGAKVCH